MAREGIVLVAVSSQTQEELQKSVNSTTGEKLPFVLLADGDHQVFRQYGCYADQPLHGVFVINPNGRLTWKSDAGVKPFMDVEMVMLKASEHQVAVK